MKKNIILFVIGIKFLLLTGIFIELTYRIAEQYVYTTSGFPEHTDFAKENEGIVWQILWVALPLILSLIVDLKEKRNAVLRGKWYLLTLSLIGLYVLLHQLNGHYTGLIAVACMNLALVLIIIKQINA